MNLLKYGIILSIALAVFWLSLSGYFIGLILTFGVISIILVVALCARMGILDHETVPYTHILSTLSYFSWLSGEIVKANMTVVKAVLKPDMVISPTLVKIPASQNTDIGRAMFANSITLTPGTVSMAIEEGGIVVHALLSDMANPEDFTEMAARSAKAVGEKGEA